MIENKIYICILSAVIILSTSYTVKVQCVAPFNQIQNLDIIVSEFPTNSASTVFHRMVVHKETGSIYIIGTTTIFQLDPQLQLVASVPTNKTTNNIKTCVKRPAVASSNINNHYVLVIDYERGKLLTCGTFCIVGCISLNLKNISTNLEPGNSVSIQPAQITGNEQEDSTVSFIAPGTLNDGSINLKNVLYVGATYRPSAWPAISSVDPENNFETINSNHRGSTYSSRFVYGFDGHDGFSYFVLNKPKNSHRPSSENVSMLVRVSQNESIQTSFVESEIQIECHLPETGFFKDEEITSEYPVARAAVLGNAKVREHLNQPNLKFLETNSPNYDQNREFLFVSFFNSGTNSSTPKSSVCIYDLQEIRNRFAEFDSFKNNGNTGISRSISTYATFEEEEEIASLSAVDSKNGDLKVIYTGTVKGQLIKYVFRNFSQFNRTTLFKSVIDTKSIPTRLKQLTFDPTLTHLYTLTDSSIKRVLLHRQNCSELSTCSQCISHFDVNTEFQCGWCFEAQSCIESTSKEAEDCFYKPMYQQRKSKQCLGQSSSHNLIHVSSKSRAIISKKIEFSDFDFNQVFLQNACEFTFLNLETDGEVTIRTINSDVNLTRTELTCLSPENSYVSTFLQENHNLTSIFTMNVTLNDGLKLFAEQSELVFFDCKNYKSCGLCTKSSFSCSWFVSGNGSKCVYDPGDLRSENEDVEEFISQNFLKTEFCSPEKEDLVTEVPEAHRPRPNKNRAQYLAILLGSVITAVVAIFIIISLVAFICIKRKKENQNKYKAYVLTNEDVSEFFEGRKNDVEKQNIDNEDVYAVFRGLSYNSEYELVANQLVIDYKNKLGAGQFGLVLLGSLTQRSKTGRQNPTAVQVAVKTVKPNVNDLYFKALLTEVKILTYLGQHENLVSLLGTQTSNIKKGQIFIALEYCAKGDLLSYLKQNRAFFHNMFGSSTDNNEDNNSEGYEIPIVHTAEGVSYSVQSTPNDYNCDYRSVLNPTISQLDLLEWSRQIADGMNYISSQNVIHGDLAARNILLTSNYVAKIGDFGLSRQLLNSEVYMKTTVMPLPWKWLAIESWKEMSFSVHSDVWAFGVTMWEIFSLGEKPYPSWNWCPEFQRWICEGNRLEPPPFGNKELHALMLSCWAEVPKDRISFAKLAADLKLILFNLDPNYKTNLQSPVK